MTRPALLLAALLFTACASTSSTYHEPVLADRLYLGRDIGATETVSDEDWSAFVRDVVARRLPAFTVYRAEGWWRGAEETVMIVEVLHQPGSDTEKTMREIAEEYRRRFRQEAVMRTTSPATMRFYEER